MSSDLRACCEPLGFGVSINNLKLLIQNKLIEYYNTHLIPNLWFYLIFLPFFCEQQLEQIIDGLLHLINA